MPSIDFSTHDPGFTADQVRQCVRIVEGLRTINSRVVRLGGSLADLTAAADGVEALLASLDPVTQARALESYRFKFDRDRPNDVIPFNPATGRFNPIAQAMNMTVDGKTVVARTQLGNAYEGAPDTVHGGLVAAVYDQLLAYAVMVEGRTGPTVWLRVTYLKPTPINVPLRFECTVDSVDGKKFTVAGICYHGEEKVSRAEAMVLAAHDLEVSGSGTVQPSK